MFHMYYNFVEKMPNLRPLTSDMHVRVDIEQKIFLLTVSLNGC